MRFIYFSIAIFLLSSSAFAANNISALIDNANAAYKAGNFKEASNQYEEVLKQDFANGHLHYNLANSYYRTEQFGKAIAHYRKALRYLPTQPDITYNLGLARSKTKDLFSAEESILNLLTPAVLLSDFNKRILFLFCFSLSLGIWVCSGLIPKARSRALLLVCSTILCYLAVLNFFTKVDRLGNPVFTLSTNQQAVVVIKSKVLVYSGNGENFQVVTVLNDGAELLGEEQRDKWIRVNLPKGRSGWINLDDLEIV